MRDSVTSISASLVSKISDGSGGRANLWFERLLSYMGTSYSWAFWSLNPNSGDTGGVLMDDWQSVEQWKVDALTPFMAPID